MKLTAQEIINLFNLYTDDTSELSSAEELALLNRIYFQICRQKPWEFLKTEASGVLSTTVPYVSLPDTFLFFSANNQKTENTTATSATDSDRVVYVGTGRRPYKVINYSDRYQYENQDGYCYADILNSRLYFTKQPASAESYVFDYITLPDELTLTDYPVFPVANDMIAYGMATDSYIIQLFDKARSYAPENNAKYKECFSDLAFYNANLRNE